MKNLLCFLNDEDYLYPEFVIKNTEKEIHEEVKKGYNSLMDYPFELLYKRKKCDKGIYFRYELQWDDEFVVIESYPFDETKGDYLLVWHHAYEGVDFKIKFQGTYEECVKERKRLIKEKFDYFGGDNADFNIETDNCIDTGSEWEVYSIVKCN